MLVAAFVTILPEKKLLARGLIDHTGVPLGCFVISVISYCPLWLP
jgi:hypothetical protein